MFGGVRGFGGLWVGKEEDDEEEGEERACFATAPSSRDV
jgi:hypothetical protein